MEFLFNLVNNPDTSAHGQIVDATSFAAAGPVIPQANDVALKSRENIPSEPTNDRRTLGLAPDSPTHQIQT